MKNLNTQIQKVVCVVNRLNVAPRSMKPGVQAELLEAARELVAAESAAPVPPANRAQVEADIARHQERAAAEKDPLKLAGIVNSIRELREKLPT